MKNQAAAIRSMRCLQRWAIVWAIAWVGAWIVPDDARADSKVLFRPPGRAKYVFLFIGDGMASAQIQAAESYRANALARDEVGGTAKALRLGMSRLPVQGMASTFAWNSLITDSAAAGTALATGKKTADGVISMDPLHARRYRTIAEVAKAAGSKVGIISSVSLDHATPACFYAHARSRSAYHDIGHELVASGFDYFGGGGLLDPDGTHPGVIPRGNVLRAAAEAGYVVTRTRRDFERLRAGRKAIAIAPVLEKDSMALYYDIDRAHAGSPDSHISLAEFTRKGIGLLRGPKGFFMMVEGGKIDWACHANDARTAIDDTIGLDAAVAVAIDFMRSHPRETLIVVTGDHETGGMSIGWAGTAYASHFEVLERQTASFLAFDKRVEEFKRAGHPPPSIAETSLVADLKNLLGLDVGALTPFERARLDDAYRKAMFGSAAHDPEEDALLYGSYNPLSVTATHLLDHRAGMGWTSYSHTAMPVPVWAGGIASETFAGFYDNTDIPKRIAAAMGIALGND